MERHRIKRLPVVQDDKLVGIVSRANLLHALASVAREIRPAAGDDATIREQILAECAKQPWATHQCGGARWRGRSLGCHYR
jgi:CBS-domain-containing membrane protein